MAGEMAAAAARRLEPKQLQGLKMFYGVWNVFSWATFILKMFHSMKCFHGTIHGSEMIHRLWNIIYIIISFIHFPQIDNF